MLTETEIHAVLYVGGIQIAAETKSILQKCRAKLVECRVAAVANSILMNNRARSAGGALFIGTVAGLRLNCSDESIEHETRFYSKKQWKSMKRLTSVDDICPSWKNNTAKRYGSDVASSVSYVQKEITDQETGMLRLVNGSKYTIHNHRSGRPIPMIVLTAVDDLVQGPAVNAKQEDIEAVMSSPNEFFVGSVRRSLGVKDANFSATGFVQPGMYKVQIEFKGADLKSFKITVEVKPCEMGEVPSGNGTFCESCSTVSYNFFPEKDMECHPCPENGNCSSQVILPNEEHWHASPCSTNIRKCLSSDACHSKERVEKLEQKTQNILTCNISKERIEEYQQAQCEEASLRF